MLKIPTKNIPIKLKRYAKNVLTKATKFISMSNPSLRGL